jgi:50S ribosomal protein L16 3-hydroxylase
MLHEWLTPVSVAAFVRRYWHTQPYARPDAAYSAVPILGWDTLARVLADKTLPDVLVVTRGKVVETPAPRVMTEVHALMRRGVGLVIRRAEQHDVGLAQLATSFGEDLPGEVHIQLFVTPTGTYSFGWHYDFEDVFIAQTAGVKEYFLRDNTVDRQGARGTCPDFERFRQEVSPLATVRLQPGDWMYIPARWWHMAKCVEDSLSISVGVFPHEEGERRAANERRPREGESRTLAERSTETLTESSHPLLLCSR